ncbi:patellin-3-like [Lolium rigidum]|uniref:patellin-3-like n=1 Tax=Lolium rigidum TaxID=89674 RepID=UPI001F5DF757|nr:patellin-3-like [Lolium rigidum]
MAEETHPQAAPAAEAAPEVVVAAEKAPAEVEKKVEEPAAEAETEESAAVADDGGAVEATGSFKEESNLVADLPDPEKKALDEFKDLIVAALAAGEFNLPPPPPPPKAKAEAAAVEETKAEEPAKTEEPAKVEEAKTEEPAKAEEAKTEEPAKEEPKAEEPKAEVVAEAEPATEPAKEEPKAEEAKPTEPKTEEVAAVVAEEATKPAESVAETVAAAATSEDTPAAPEPEADAVAPPEPVFIWGVPLVGDDERTDAVLLKFLRAREFKVKEAMAMLRSAVLWRKRFGIDALLDADLAFPELDKVVFYRGADRESHPVCYNVYGEFQDKDLYEKAFGDEEKRERFLKWRIQLLERGILSQLDFAPSGICSMVQVTDLKNSPPMLGKHRAVTRQAVALLQDNYPEFIAKKVFINVPWWYLAANKMMSPFLTQRTRSKFVFASQAKSPETLFRYIAPEQVPIQFGGLYKEDDPEFTTSDSVTELTIKASSKETIEIPVTENSTIVWELRVLGWEVSYGAEFTPAAEGGYTVIVQKTRKVPANEEPIMKGSFKVTEAGKIALTINNPASKKKKLLYRSKVKSTSESV